MPRPTASTSHPRPNLRLVTRLNPDGLTKEQWQAHYALSPHLADIFWSLMGTSEYGFISADELASHVYGNIRWRMKYTGLQAITRSIERLRRKISFGLYEIRTLNTVGYRLVRKGHTP